jgi:hypothetical protein
MINEENKSLILGHMLLMAMFHAIDSRAFSRNEKPSELLFSTQK